LRISMVRLGYVLAAGLLALLVVGNFLTAQQTSSAPQPRPAEKKAAAARPSPTTSAPVETKVAATAPATPASPPTGQEVVPKPPSPKEQMGVYVFMAWLWAAIIVLVFILRAKVREADRLFEARYLSDDKHSHT